MKSRSNNSYETFIQDFLKFDIFVSCPYCNQRAVVKTGAYDFKSPDQNEIRFVCSSCGHGKKLIEKADLVFGESNSKKYTGKIYHIGGPIDPFFHFPVWLQTEFEGNLLWVYNIEHLIFLETHIKSKLRERNGKAASNKSLGSRLPTWMTASKNRNSVLKKLDLLRAKIEK